ncbi:MAG: peptidoglycan DD-metalloendopeptidase family protein [Gammaproteobacteria bacterium]|nr:peptidoglycan DD-metalloendopeptidase family protein [Gammaproteobacteria bacterium]
MHQRPSPLLHDYKPSGTRHTKKPKALQWFAVGLGIPLAGLAMISMLVGEQPAAPTVEQAALLPAGEIQIDDVTNLPREEVVQALIEPVLDPVPQFDSLNLTIGRGDTLDKLFRQHNLNLGHLAAVAALEEPRKIFRRLKPGDEFDILHDNGSIVSMYSVLDLTSALKIERGEEGFSTEIVERPIEVRKRIAYGVIETSLFESGADASLSDKVIMNVAGIFAWDIDFVLDIRQGDNFYVQYEEIWQNDEFVTDGEIIVAEFNNNRRTHRAIRFIDADGYSDYFTPEGDSVRKAFIRAPVDFTRVSSNFNPRRRHPILNKIRAHRGVDYAAPRGTPIKAAGNGKVIFRGVKNGYGNAIILQHGGNITTLYAHMSGFAASARIGRRMRQGQTIGYVGATGLATANHLHYEYRLNGVHRNPRTVALPKAEPIDAKYRDEFLASVEPILEELEHFKRTQVAAVGYAGQ